MNANPLLTHIKNIIPSPLYLKVRSLLLKVKKVLKTVYRALVSDEYCEFYINWNMPPHRWDNMTKIHWCYTRAVWRKKKFYALLSFISWPFKSCIFALKRTRQCGPDLRQKTGIALGRQFLDQVYLAIRYFIPPRAYYFYGLYEPVNRNLGSMYVHDHEIGLLLALLNISHNHKVFDDKRYFFSECKRFGLPTIPIIAEFEDGRLKMPTDIPVKELPGVDLFAKPALGKCGKGVKLFNYVKESNRYRCDDGTMLTQDQIMCQLAEYSKESPYILQEKLFNHPDISKLSPGALCTSRVVTCRLPDGSFEVITSIFKIPTGNCCTDNFATGGLAAPVHNASGILGMAITKNLTAERVDRHLETGQKIAGFRIPYWDEVVRLCLQAHAGFSDFAFVGWDVAVSKDGPVLVEGNLNWGVESMQRAHNLPLGKTHFAESYMLHIKHQDYFHSIVDPNFWTPEHAVMNSCSMPRDVLR
jgi:hypothetical protein